MLGSCFSTFYLQLILYVCLSVCLPLQCGNGDAGSIRLFYFVTTRMFLVGLTLLVAVVVPNFHLLMSFIGSITCVLLVFVFPCIFHIILHHRYLTVFGIALDVVLVLISTSAGVSGIYASYNDLMTE